MSDGGEQTELRRVSALVRARRGELGWSLQRVADSVGCAKSYLSEVENENRLPEEAMLRKIERAMKLTRGVLVEAARWQRGLAAGGETLEAELARLRASDEARRRLQELLRTRGGLDAAYRSGELGALVGEEGTEARRHGGTKGDRLQIAEGRGPIGEGPAGTAGRPRGSTHKDELHQGVSMGANVRTYVVADVRRHLPREVPLINKVAAGYPTEFTDLGYPARVADEYVRAPDIDDPDAFAARVVGDSMEPEYREGDVIVFSPGKVVKSGDDCFVRMERDGETTFKRVYFEGEGTEAGDAGTLGRGDGGKGGEAERRRDGETKSGEKEEGIEASRHRGIEAEGTHSGREDCNTLDAGGVQGAEDIPTPNPFQREGLQGGGWIRLQPLNNAYPAKVVRREDVAGLYAAVTWIRKLGARGSDRNP